MHGHSDKPDVEETPPRPQDEAETKEPWYGRRSGGEAKPRGSESLHPNLSEGGRQTQKREAETRESRLELKVQFYRIVARLALQQVGELLEEREWLHDRLDKQGQREFRRRVRKRVPDAAVPDRVQGE